MASEGKSQFFSMAKGTNIYGGAFTAVQGDMHIHPANRPGLKLLIRNIARGAFHDAGERGDPPRCHPHTRSAIRKEIIELIKAPEAQRKLIIWLYGPAGAGKTAIEQSIAEQCKEEGLLAASFFFSRAAAGRNDSSQFVATLAYQLLLTIPLLSEPVLAAVERDPTIFSRALSVQMQTLVVAPLKSVPIPLPNLPRVAVVDGIDECGPDGNSQAKLLAVLGAAAAELRHVPIIFLIASRPEYEIRQAFDQKPLSSLTRKKFLDNDFQADEDIRLYLNSKFQDIRRNSLTLGTAIAPTWPTAGDITQLVKKSSGQFIFAATVMKFIDSPRRHPVDRLNIILGLSDAGKETPFAALDALYYFILSAVDDLPKVLQVLTLLVLANDYSDKLRVDVVEKLLGFDVQRVLMDMHSLLFVPSPNDPKSILRIHHASLYDFLIDQSRSRDQYIDPTQGHIFLSQRWLGAVSDYPRFQINTFHLNRCIHSFVYHCDQSPTSSEVLDCLAAFNLGALLERIVDASDIYSTRWSIFFECARQQREMRPDIFPRFQDEFCAFFFERLVQYPSSLRTHIPALFFHSNHWESRALFRILLKSASGVAAELEELRKVDQRLLKLHEKPILKSSPRSERGFDDVEYGESDFSLPFLRDKDRPGRYEMDLADSYAALIKQVVIALWFKPGERQIAITNLEIESLGLGRDWFRHLLRRSSINSDLARALQERTLQYEYVRRSTSPQMKGIAQDSLEYIKKCGIQYLKHTHKANTNRCVVCETCGRDASVVEDMAHIPNNDIPPTPPSHLSGLAVHSMEGSTSDPVHALDATPVYGPGSPHNPLSAVSDARSFAALLNNSLVRARVVEAGSPARRTPPTSSAEQQLSIWTRLGCCL